MKLSLKKGKPGPQPGGSEAGSVKSAELRANRFSSKQLSIFGIIFAVLGIGLVIASFADIGPGTDADLKNLGTNKSYRQGMLVRTNSVAGGPSSQVYVIDRTENRYGKRPISTTVMERLGYPQNDIITIPENLMPKSTGSAVNASRHPNSTIVKYQNDFWYITGDKRIRFASTAVMRSYGTRAYAATSGDMKLPERKSKVSQFLEGAVLKVVDQNSKLNGNIYHIERHGNPFPLPATYQKDLVTPAAFAALGYKTEELINVTEGMLPKNTGPTLTDKATAHLPGTDIRFADGTYWRVSAKGKVKYADVSVLRGNGRNASFAKPAITKVKPPVPPTVTAENDEKLPVAATLGYRNGTLVEPVNEDPVYVIENHDGIYRKRHVGSRATMNALGYTWESNVIQNVPRSTLPAADGPSITPDRHADGQAIRNSNGTVWLIDNGTRRSFRDGQVLASWRFGANVYPATAADLALPEGEPVGFAEGTLVRSVGGTVYVIENHDGLYKKRQISQAAMIGFGFKDSEIRPAASDALLPTETGPAITAPTGPHPLGTPIRGSDGVAYLINRSGKSSFVNVNILNSYGFGYGDIKGATPVADIAFITSDQYKNTIAKLKATIVPASGAYGSNADWDAGKPGATVNMALQQYADDSVAYGISSGDQSYIDNGMRMIKWAMDHQGSDGSFQPRSQCVFPGDCVHDDTFVVEAAARSFLLILNSQYASQYMSQINAYKPKLLAALAYQTREPQWGGAYQYGSFRWFIDTPVYVYGSYGYHMHQHYLFAASVGMTYQLTGDPTYLPFAYERLNKAISMQDPSGCQLEGTIDRDGCDSGYGAEGLRALQHWIAWMPDNDMTTRVSASIMDKAMAWQAGRVGADGHINSSGNTRTCVWVGGDQGKNPGYDTFTETLSFWAAYRDKPELITPANNVWSYMLQVRNGTKPLCVFTP